MSMTISDPIETFDDEEHAVTTNTNKERILNLSSLVTHGDLANGILADANRVLIINDGSIETNGLGAAGIFAKGQDIQVENYGSIVTTGDPTPDEQFFSEGIFVSGNRYYIVNQSTGFVRVEGVSASGLVGDGVEGTIINYGTVESSSTNSSAIAAIGHKSQAINEGVVRVTPEGDDNALMFVLGNDASAFNRGVIEGTGAGNIGMEGVIVDTVLTNEVSGTIELTGDRSIGMAAFGDGHQLINFGSIETSGTFAFGMAARGGGLSGRAGLDLEVTNDGQILTNGDGAIGIALGVSNLGFRPAEGGLIENSGEIETVGDGAAGVFMSGAGHQLINSGEITSNGGTFATGETHGDLRAAGVVVSGDDAWVTNTGTGIIQSQNAESAAVELNVLEQDGLPAADMSSLLENFGLIEGATVAVLGAAGQETVINHGSIVGNVLLGGGDDAFAFGEDGTLDGDLFLGDGDDLVRIEDGSGSSQIEDFVAGAATDDAIDVSAFFSSFEDLFANSNDSGSGVVIALDADDVLVLVGVSKNDLHGDDFSFA
jgi:hypothetical protein